MFFFPGGNRAFFDATMPENSCKVAKMGKLKSVIFVVFDQVLATELAC